MLPDDPCSSEFREYASKVNNPTINLQTIRQKLTYRYYNSLEEFVQEMMTLFNNWVDLKGKNNKMYTQCDNMKKRFEKFIEKNRNKYASSGTSLGGDVPRSKLDSSLRIYESSNGHQVEPSQTSSAD